MITARPQKQLKAAKSYFREHLGQGDYYSEKQRVAGQWFGHGAERLGLDLSSPVSEAAFLRLCDNQHPGTGEKLTARQRRERRVFYDFVLSAPKSISILALTMGDARLLAAHDAAFAEVVGELEKAAAVRVRRGGQRSERTTGEIVAAAFRHDASRALDPQLHTHLVVFNATYDPVEKAWRALEPERMFAQSRYLTEVYRNALALRLTALGYRLRPTANGFEIEGVAEDVITRFSKRRQAIVRAEARITAQLGQRLTNSGRAAVAHAGKSALIVSPTWREIEEVTGAVRAELKRGGHLRGREAGVEVHVPKRWTKAEKRDFLGYDRGQVVTFHQATKEFARGEWARVVSVESEKLVVAKPGGEQVNLTRKQSGCYDVAEAEPLPVARGERLLLQASRREAKLLNGQLVTVKSVRRDGRTKLTDGWVIPSGFRQFTHGYCVTSPAAQGQTADHVHVAKIERTSRE